MEEVLRTAAGMMLSIVLPLLVQLWDRRRLRRHGRDAPWGYASWGAALYAFGPFSMWAWSHLSFARPWRWLMGPASTALLIVPILALSAEAGPWQERLQDGAAACAVLFIAGVLVLLAVDVITSVLRRLGGAGRASSG